jgi:hypothetical protein
MGKTEVEPGIYALQKRIYAGKTDNYSVETDRYIFRCLQATAKDIALVGLFVSRKSTILCRLL